MRAAQKAEPPPARWPALRPHTLVLPPWARCIPSCIVLFDMAAACHASCTARDVKPALSPGSQRQQRAEGFLLLWRQRLNAAERHGEAAGLAGADRAECEEQPQRCRPLLCVARAGITPGLHEQALQWLIVCGANLLLCNRQPARRQANQGGGGGPAVGRRAGTISKCCQWIIHGCGEF
jgi:hypothetical protein